MHALLEVISAGAVKTVYDIELFIKSTLFAAQTCYDDVHRCVKEQLELLVKKNLICWSEPPPGKQAVAEIRATESVRGLYAGTLLGHAVVGSGMRPAEGLLMHRTIAQARKSFVMNDDLHMIFVITPLGHGVVVWDWNCFERIFADLPEAARLAAENIGVEHSILHRASSGGQRVVKWLSDRSPDLQVYHRFYAALMLRDIIQEKSLSSIAAKFKQPAGNIQRIQERAISSAASIHRFCDRMNWPDMASLVAIFQKRLAYGVQPDIAPICEIPHMNPRRARALFASGLRSIESIAAAKLDVLRRALKVGITSPRDLNIETRAANLILKNAQKIIIDRVSEIESLAAGWLGPAPMRPNPDQLNVSGETKNAHGANTMEGSGKSSSGASSIPSLVKEGSLSFVDVGLMDVAGAEFKAFCDLWRAQDMFALHVPRDSGVGKRSLNGFSVYWGGLSVYFCTWSGGVGGLSPEIRALVAERLSSRSAWALYDTGTQLRRVSAALGIRSEPNISLFDVKIACWMLDPARYGSSPHALKLDAIVRETVDDGLLRMLEMCASEGLDVPSRAMCLRVVKEHYTATSIRRVLGGMNGLDAAFRRIEAPLAATLAGMECSGMSFSVIACQKLRDAVQKRICDVEAEAMMAAGKSFDIRSSRSVAKILFQHLGLPATKAEAVGKRLGARVGLSTNAEVLQDLVSFHPLPGLVMEHRRLQKFVSEHMDTLPSLARRHRGRNAISSRIHQTCTPTGRIVTEYPNIQCIPHAFFMSTRGSLAQPSGLPAADTGKFSVNLRNMFEVPEGRVLISADYAQVEVRIMAHLSGDVTLCGLFADGRGDFYRALASTWLHGGRVEEQAVSEAERTMAKKLCLGLLYGMGDVSLSEQLGCSPDEAKHHSSSFRASFPRLQEWMGEVRASCRQGGFIETMARRRRYMSVSAASGEMQGPNAQLDRQAINSACQGSAADLLKIALITFDRLCSAVDEVRRGRRACDFPAQQVLAYATEARSAVPSARIEHGSLCAPSEFVELTHGQGAPFFPVMCVHDEIIVEADAEDLVAVSRALAWCMEAVLPLAVPTPVRIRAGRSWGSMIDVAFRTAGAS